MIRLPFRNTVSRPPLVTYPSLCSICVTYRTPCHSIGHQVLLTQPLPREVEDFLGVRGTLSMCLPLNTFSTSHQKRYIGRFYLMVRAAQSWNINLYGELVLRNISFKIFAPFEIWTLFTVDVHDTNLMFCLFGHRALRIVINYS